MNTFDFEMIRKFILSTSKNTSIYVGCDSKQFQNYTLFVTVIVVHIDSCRGAKIFSEAVKTCRIKSLRERLLKEVDFAIYAALNIIDIIEDRHLEIVPPFIDIYSCSTRGCRNSLRKSLK